MKVRLYSLADMCGYLNVLLLLAIVWVAEKEHIYRGVTASLLYVVWFVLVIAAIRRWPSVLSPSALSSQEAGVRRKYRLSLVVTVIVQLGLIWTFRSEPWFMLGLAFPIPLAMDALFRKAMFQVAPEQDAQPVLPSR